MHLGNGPAHPDRSLQQHPGSACTFAIAASTWIFISPEGGGDHPFIACALMLAPAAPGYLISLLQYRPIKCVWITMIGDRPRVLTSSLPTKCPRGHKYLYKGVLIKGVS
jgi:hypothetical protein